MARRHYKRNDIKVNLYERNNETINRLMDESDGPLWIVNGPVGRKPIYARTEDDAVEDYLDRFYQKVEEENDLEMDCL